MNRQQIFLLGFLGVIIWSLFQRPKRDYLLGGLADNYDDSEFDPDSLDDGEAIELEHTNNRAIAREIARDHLVEDANYYKKLATIENPKNKRGRKPKRKNPKSKYEMLRDDGYAEEITDAYARAAAAKEDDPVIMDEILYQELGYDLPDEYAVKNPGGRCTYTAVVDFVRGGRHQRKTMLADAWSLPEAENKFRSIINRSLRDATLESLHVSKASC